MKEEVKKLLEKSDHAILVAQSLIEDGFHSDAASKLYYAMFYAAQALLKANGIEVIKHSAVESALGFHFVKTGKLDAQFHKIFIHSRKIREIADYDMDAETITPQSPIDINEAKALIKKFKELISSK